MYYEHFEEFHSCENPEHAFYFFFCRLCFVIVTLEHSAVLSQRSGVALLADRQQKQDWFPSGPPAHCSFKLADARRQYFLYTAGIRQLIFFPPFVNLHVVLKTLFCLFIWN